MGPRKIVWTDEENRQAVLAHNAALTTMHFGFDSVEYWNYIAERVQKPLAEVRRYWKKNTVYIDYADRGGWTDEEKRQVVLAHNAALTTMHFEFNSVEYWNYLAERVRKPLAEVRQYWERHTVYINYGL
ncbi:hypothetical protein ACHQM5_005349 [Ranunculus cassubicifolius]